MKKFFQKWILIGLALRLILMPITVHPDIRVFDLGAYLISQKGEVFSFYDYLSGLDSNDPLLRTYPPDALNYPPLAYLVPAAFMTLLRPFYNFSFNSLFLEDMGQTYQKAALYQTLFLLKLPYLLFDGLLAYLLYLILSGKKGELRQSAGKQAASVGGQAFKLWMLNPITLYATFAIGQIEIFTILSIIIALWFALKNKKEAAVMVLGVGGAFKLFPLLLLPIFALVLEKRLWQRIRLSLIGLAPYLAIIAPYLLFSPMYRQAAFLTGQTQKMLYMDLPVSGAESLPVFALGYFALLFLANRLSGKKDFLWKLILVMLLLFFSVTHYHPQWFLWITPFLIWDWLVFGKKHLNYWLILLACYLVIVFFFESSLHLGLFAPIAPSLLGVGSLSEWLGHFYNIFVIKSLIRALFAVSAGFLIFNLFRNEKNPSLS